jgi:glutaredoxin-like protein NrdH
VTEQETGRPVTIYTLPDCVACTLTKRAFDRRSPDLYEEVPLTDEKMDEFRRQGIRSAPVVVARGLFWYGLRPDLIQQAWKEIQRDRLDVGRP